MSKHSFSLSLEDEDYQALKELADREDRHIYEQARHMLRRLLKAHADGRMIMVPVAEPGDAPEAPEYRVPVDASPDSMHRILTPEALAHVAKGPLPG